MGVSDLLRSCAQKADVAAIVFALFGEARFLLPFRLKIFPSKVFLFIIRYPFLREQKITSITYQASFVGLFNSQARKIGISRF